MKARSTPVMRPATVLTPNAETHFAVTMVAGAMVGQSRLAGNAP